MELIEKEYIMDYTLETGQQILRTRLKHENLLVTFTKKDGSERTMRCTLNNAEIPSSDTKEKSARSVPTTALAVFDLDKKEWRSFRWDSILEVKNESE